MEGENNKNPILFFQWTEVNNKCSMGPKFGLQKGNFLHQLWPNKVEIHLWILLVNKLIESWVLIKYWQASTCKNTKNLGPQAFHG
jgi:hypothetical protein